MSNESIGSRLKYIREKFSTSASQFAKDNMLEVRTYNSYENNERKQNLNFLERLHLEYNINLNWLILGTGDYTEKHIPTVPENSEDILIERFMTNFRMVLRGDYQAYKTVKSML